MDITPQTGYGLQPDDYPPDYDPSLNGIGGFLILVIIGRFFSIITGITNMANLVSAYTINNFIVIISLIITLVIRIFLPILILVLMFTCNKLFRIFLIIELSLILVINILNNDLISAVQNIVIGAIWIPYLFISKRVKNTYIYPRLYPSYEDMYGYASAGPAAQVPEETDMASKVSAEPTADGAYFIKDIQVPDSDQVECPECNTVQRNNRSCCYNCGARFIL